ncbi:DegV family protein [Paenibacillus physcomitrellae]|uniref:DegV domain-containing protein n=1 Tax=Paenibacillus physcomitrellae TaxID=1619311 RepID=A0ABQ1GXN7_9BACL|nr:DegV family protein [Paenibacillus physcomitrellae]GGA52461.1 DegV domain-containing protein [Paenibacillus physcomitrellae]
MSSIKIFADSTCDLSADLIKQYDIGIVPLYVTFESRSYRDGIDLTPPELYTKVSETGKLPLTAAPSPSDFVQAFAPFVEQGRQIVYISLSSELSSTYQNALIASEEFEQGIVNVFDSLNLSTGIGIQVLKAARAAEAGQNVHQILSLLADIRPKVDTEFVIDSLDYLHKGGRCSGMQNVVASLLKIRPVIKVIDGKMTPAYKVRGSREKAFDQMVSNALGNKETMDRGTLFVTQTMAQEDAKNLRGTLQDTLQPQEVFITEAGCVICSHCGPKTIGIIYLKE